MTDPTPADHAAWIARAAAAKFETGLFIDGRSTAGSGQPIPAINPATGALLAELSCGSAGDIDRAVASAKQAWDDGRWRHMAPRARMDIFRRWADLVEESAAELALLETLGMGKPIGDALGIDLPETVVTIRYFGEAIDKIGGVVTNSPHKCQSYGFARTAGRGGGDLGLELPVADGDLESRPGACGR